jgi:DNA topoisomerase-1
MRNNRYRDCLNTNYPNNGKKTDPAHPAIYPTGLVPDYEKMQPREIRIYDLIVRRFLATFAEAATRETNKILLDVEKEKAK